MIHTPDVACRVSIMLSSFESNLLIEADEEIVRSGPMSVAVEFAQLDLDSYYHPRQLILNNTDDPEEAEKEFSFHWEIRPRPLVIGAIQHGSYKYRRLFGMMRHDVIPIFTNFW